MPGTIRLAYLGKPGPVAECNVKADPEALMENYRIGAQARQVHFDPAVESPILFDTVAVFMAFSNQFLKFKRMGL
jgi:hypothetical protein